MSDNAGIGDICDFYNCTNASAVFPDHHQVFADAFNRVLDGVSGYNGPGVTWDPCGQPGNDGGGCWWVHNWFDGATFTNGVTQDFTGPGGPGAIMRYCCWSPWAYWVHGAIWTAYFGQGGAPGWMGYPTSEEGWFYDWRRQSFEAGYICWKNGVGARVWDWDNPPTPTFDCDYNFNASITSPAPGSILPGSSVVFTRNSGSNVVAYSLYVGTVPGSYNIFAGYMSSPSQLVTNIPTNGYPVYVRLWSYFNSCACWQWNDYTYTAATIFQKAQITFPQPFTTLHGPSVTFWRDNGSGVVSYSLWVGAAPASYQYFAGYMSSPSQLVTNLPANNTYIYVRLWSSPDGYNWQFNDYWYISAP